MRDRERLERIRERLDNFRTADRESWTFKWLVYDMADDARWMLDELSDTPENQAT